MAEPYDRKAQLVAELEQSRRKMGREFQEIRGGLNVGSRLRAAFFRQKAVWVTGALLGGWLLTRLPVRRKKASTTVKVVEAKEGKSMVWAILGLLVTLLKPAVTSILSDKLAEYVARRQAAPSPERSSPRGDASTTWR
mgnify:CR=1 FL=1